MMNNYSIVVDKGELCSPMSVGVHRRYHISHIIRSYTSGTIRWVPGVWYEIIRTTCEPEQFDKIISVINKSYPGMIITNYLGWGVEESQL